MTKEANAVALATLEELIEAKLERIEDLRDEVTALHKAADLIRYSEGDDE